MTRRPKPVVPHREMFRVGEHDEVVATPCTCARGADHWYAQPLRMPHSDREPGEPGESAQRAALAEPSKLARPTTPMTRTASRSVAGLFSPAALVSRSQTRSPGRAARAS